MNIIEINNFTKYYGKFLAIDDLSLTVKEGEIFGFIGPNGAGKSTTIRAMMSLIHATSGTISIFGKDVGQFGVEIRQQVGYLPSEVFYYEGMKAIDLLKYSASFYPDYQFSRILELAETLELDLNRKIADLSYGNRKKVGIIQTLLHQPKLIILDEPTSGLDPLIQQKFLDLIKEANKNGATVIFSSHILSEVQKICDRVAIIKNGKIIKIDKVDNLKKTNHKKIKVVVENNELKEDLLNVEGISKLVKKTNYVEFIYSGDINKIVDIIQKMKISDLLIEEPTLEEVFFHYYE